MVFFVSLSMYSFFVFFFCWFLQNRCPWISTQIQMIIMIIIMFFFGSLKLTRARAFPSNFTRARVARSPFVRLISISIDLVGSNVQSIKSIYTYIYIYIYRRKASVSWSRRARPHSVYMKHTIERLGSLSLSLEECPTS